MAGATFSDMPQEILDEIVDHGVDSALQLRSCALVCRSLRSRAQMYLFVHVYIYTTERIFQLINIMQENPLIIKYIDTIHTSSQLFIPIHGIDTTLASLFLLIKSQAPNSSLFLAVHSRTSDTAGRHSPSRPMNNISQELLMYSMSVIARLELDELVDFPAAALLNFRRLRYVIWNNTTLYPKISNILAPHRMSALPPFFFRNITCLEIVNIDDFPAVLISYCHALKDLNLANMTFLDPDAAPTPSTLPYIDDLYVSTYNIEMIQTLVDRVVDLSRLQQLHDRMSLDMKYEVEEFEKDEEIIECHRHLLSKSKNSLTKLFLTCLFQNYSSGVLAIPFPLSGIPDLEILCLVFNCPDDAGQLDAPLYLHDLLKTIDAESTQIKSLTMDFNIVLKSISTDENGLPMAVDDTPLLLSHGIWDAIGTLFSGLTKKCCTRFRITLFCSEPEAPGNRQRDVSHIDAATALSETLSDWAEEHIVPDSLSVGRSGVIFTLAVQFL